MQNDDEYATFYERMIAIPPLKFFGHHAMLKDNRKRGVVSEVFERAMNDVLPLQMARAGQEELNEEMRDSIMIDNAKICTVCSIYCVHKQPLTL